MEENHTNKEPVPPKMSNKESIANLAKMVACFEPVFVNENGDVAPRSVAMNPKRSPAWQWEGKFQPKIDTAPTMDEFINTAAGAIMGMREFISDYETLRAKFDDMEPKHRELVVDATIAHRASMQKGFSAPTLVDLADTWISRFLQALDVFKSIYETDISKYGPTNAAEAAETFQRKAYEFAKRFVNEKFLKPIGGGLSNSEIGLSGAPTVLPEPAPEPAADAGANPDSDK